MANPMANDSRFKLGQSGNPQSTFKAGNRYRWQPGQSGNPAGIARSRLRFEECFYASLIEQGAAEEAASLLWGCARKREPWAVQALLQRLAPETKQIRSARSCQIAFDGCVLARMVVDRAPRIQMVVQQLP